MAIVSAVIRSLTMARPKQSPLEIRMAICGVRQRGWIFDRKAGSWFCSARAISILGMATTMISTVPTITTRAPAETASAPMPPKIWRPASRQRPVGGRGRIEDAHADQQDRAIGEGGDHHAGGQRDRYVAPGLARLAGDHRAALEA